VLIALTNVPFIGDNTAEKLWKFFGLDSLSVLDCPDAHSRLLKAGYGTKAACTTLVNKWTTEKGVRDCLWLKSK
jgi:phage regulator Rha-like protein